jgi:hypothetical protein
MGLPVTAHMIAKIGEFCAGTLRSRPVAKLIHESLELLRVRRAERQIMIPAAGCHNLVTESLYLIADESEDSTTSSQSASAEESGESDTTHQSAGQLDVDVDEEDDTESDAEEETEGDSEEGTETNDENDTNQTHHRDEKSKSKVQAVQQFPEQKLYPEQSQPLPHSSQQSTKPSTAEEIPFDLDVQFQDVDETRSHDENHGGDSESDRGDEVQGTPGPLNLQPFNRQLESESQQQQKQQTDPQPCSKQLTNRLQPQQHSPQSQQPAPTSRQACDYSVEVYNVYQSGESEFDGADGDNEGDISQQFNPESLELHKQLRQQEQQHQPEQLAQQQLQQALRDQVRTLQLQQNLPDQRPEAPQTHTLQRQQQQQYQQLAHPCQAIPQQQQQVQVPTHSEWHYCPTPDHKCTDIPWSEIALSAHLSYAHRDVDGLRKECVLCEFDCETSTTLRNHLANKHEVDKLSSSC